MHVFLEVNLCMHVIVPTCFDPTFVLTSNYSDLGLLISWNISNLPIFDLQSKGVCSHVAI